MQAERTGGTSRFSTGLAVGLSATVVVFIVAAIAPGEFTDAMGRVSLGLFFFIALLLMLSGRLWRVGLGIAVGEAVAIACAFLIALEELGRHTS